MSKDFQDKFYDKAAAFTLIESADAAAKTEDVILENASEVCRLSRKHQLKREIGW